MFQALKNTGVIDNLVKEYETLLKLVLKDWKAGDRLEFDDWQRIPEVVRKRIADKIVKDTSLIKKFIQYWKTTKCCVYEFR